MPIDIPLSNGSSVSGLLQYPPTAQACFVFAHGAGAGMAHPLMAAVATGLADRGVATLRYQFPYMERGLRRPDSPRVAHEAVRAAVEIASQRCSDLTLIAGGKSFGGRMTSQAQAELTASRFSAFRCILPASLPSSGRTILLMSPCQCCFCKASGTSWPT